MRLHLSFWLARLGSGDFVEGDCLQISKINNKMIVVWKNFEAPGEYHLCDVSDVRLVVLK